MSLLWCPIIIFQVGSPYEKIREVLTEKKIISVQEKISSKMDDVIVYLKNPEKYEEIHACSNR